MLHRVQATTQSRGACLGRADSVTPILKEFFEVSTFPACFYLSNLAILFGDFIGGHIDTHTFLKPTGLLFDTAAMRLYKDEVLGVRYLLS